MYIYIYRYTYRHVYIAVSITWGSLCVGALVKRGLPFGVCIGPPEFLETPKNDQTRGREVHVPGDEASEVIVSTDPEGPGSQI